MKNFTKKILNVALILLMVIVLAGPAMADVVTMTGKIILVEDYLMLDAGDKKYFLDGEVEDDLINQEVEAKGTVEKNSDDNEFLVIESIGPRTN